MNDSKEKWYLKFNDARFTSYIESGEAEAVHIVRDIVRSVNTTGKWIDVLSHSNGLITCELFPRITHPKYTADPDMNKYLTWHAAHADISVHRSRGAIGEKFRVTYIPRYNSETKKTSYQIVSVKKIN